MQEVHPPLVVLHLLLPEGPDPDLDVHQIGLRHAEQLQAPSNQNRNQVIDPI